MSETLLKLRPMVDAMTPDERNELIAYASQVDQESLDEMLDRRKREYESGAVKGIPAEEVFSKLRKKHQ